MSTPVGPYTPIVAAGPWLIVSGQVGIRDGSLVDESLAGQLRQALSNLQGLLESKSARLDQVVKTTVFLTDTGDAADAKRDYAEMNEIYTGFFGDHRPARSAVYVARLPIGARIEVEAWAYTG